MPLNKSSNQPTFIQSNLSSLLVGCFLVAGHLIAHCGYCTNEMHDNRNSDYGDRFNSSPTIYHLELLSSIKGGYVHLNSEL